MKSLFIMYCWGVVLAIVCSIFAYRCGCIETQKSFVNETSSIERKAVRKFIASRTPYIWMDGFNGRLAPVGYTGPRWIMVDEPAKIPTNIKEMPDTVESTIIIKLDK